MNDFENAVALITGAASGIGAATATVLAARGARKLILVDQQEDRLRDFAFTLPCERQVIVGDVTDEAMWANADLTGVTHALVNAGIGAGEPIDTLRFEEWRRVLSVNLDGAFLTLQAAMRAMKGNGGAIVLTASVAGLKAEPGIAAYAASKAAVIQLAKVAAKEGAPARIRVNAIAPGGVETAIWSGVPFFQTLVEKTGSEEAAFQAMGNAATPMGRFARAEEIAEQIAFLLSDKAAFVTGSCLVSDGGYSL
ncbi:SDR family NAD(P)-dependent oxidoreductase [Sphingosinicella sp. BN140058]|uniref:SDR family NAD(P)-dependent oxidoreductase n=1 Tax=Sphingosinicella sp. BN140058 TaxID=1892855 RepID=UPI0010134083|nr:SDR family oxidoreductase [Sphingosinicella sp. BN140058]QAY78424.1 SDR family oxidoreductase [Sphingosinicella sp. BN140058]